MISDRLNLNKIRGKVIGQLTYSDKNCIYLLALFQRYFLKGLLFKKPDTYIQIMFLNSIRAKRCKLYKQSNRKEQKA